MTVEYAKRFIRQAMSDAELRGELNRASDDAERKAALEARGLSFTPEEFEEARQWALTNCQTEEQGNALKEFAMWWAMASSDG